jgi:hypothetical protein
MYKLSFFATASDAISEWILDEDMIVGSVSEADLAMVYNLLLVVNEHLTRILTVVTLVFALMLFLFVFRLISNIFNKI